jgi:hypothetical protein
MQSLQEMALREAECATWSRRDLNDLVDLCIELAVSWRQHLEAEYSRIYQEPNLPVTWLQERRRVIEELSDDYLQLAESIRTAADHADLVAEASRERLAVSQLGDAVRAVIQAKQRVLERWPVDSNGEIVKKRRGTILSEPILVANLPLPPDVAAMIAEHHRSSRLSWREHASREEDVKLRYHYAGHYVMATASRRGLAIHAIDLEDPDEVHELRQRLTAQGYRHVLSLFPDPLTSPNSQIITLNPQF